MKKKYYTNGVNEHRFSPEEEIPEGWYKGRLKSPATTTGRIKITDGINEKFINKNEPIPDGWIKGRPHRKQKKKKDKFFIFNNGVVNKHFTSLEDVPDGWKKGALPLSDYHKQRCSEGHQGLHHTDEAKKKISENSNNNREKAYKTISEKYGSLEDYFKYISDKGNKTKAKNGTFNTSKIEKEILKDLRKLFGYEDVLTQYKSKVYPFRCDYYIRSLDLYIELNSHWTHGGRPFDNNDEDCIAQLKVWEEKSKTSEFYKNAINTWTVRDVLKLDTAKKNNLNYKVIYLEDKKLHEFLENLNRDNQKPSLTSEEGSTTIEIIK